MLNGNGLKRRVKEIFHHKHKYINGTKGVISLFLALLMLPFATIAGSLINAARVDSAVAIFDEALSNASNSTLGTYDDFLRKRFGLLAMKQTVTGTSLSQEDVSALISDTFDFYLQENLKTLSNTYISSESESKGIYSLADPNVLLGQVLEYSKYSVPVKLVEDALPLNDLIKSLEGAIPGSNLFSLITSGTGMADSMITLGEDYQLLEDAVAEEDTAITNYNSAYDTFSADAAAYIAKKQEMDNELANLQTNIDNASASADSLQEQINTLNQEIADLEEEQEKNKTDKSKEIAEKKKSLEDVTKDYDKAVSDKTNAQNSYNSKKSSYESQLSTLKTNLTNSKSAYSAAISELSGKMTAVKGKVVTVQNDYMGAVNSAVNVATDAVTYGIEQEKTKTDQNISQLKEELDKADESGKENLNKQIQEMNDKKVGLDNQKTIAKAGGDGVKAGLDSIKQSIYDFDVEIYTRITDQLTALKTKVDNYDLNDVKSVTREEYYVTLAGRLTKEAVEKAEADCMRELAGASVWGTLKAMASFLRSLFKITLVYDPQLGAVIDTKYYEDTYGGLPSKKDRDAYPLSEGEEGDRELSEYYKSLFGDYSSDGSGLLGGFDVIETLRAIFTDFSVINSDAKDIVSVKKLSEFGKMLKEMFDAAVRIVSNITEILTFLGKALLEAVFNKALLSGYVSYMTSNRTTYQKTALTGTSFNARGQDITPLPDVSYVTDMLSLVNTIIKTYTGGTEKCFVGAETEYIIFGSTAELANQAAAFGVIYLIRLVTNLFNIFTNSEVASIAAASTIAAPLVYLIYVLLEPLVDTIILVNGGTEPLIKTMVYLTPSGLSAMISKFTTLKLTTSQLDSAKSDLTEAWGASDYTERLPDATDKSIFPIDYSKILLLIMTIFISREKMLDRLSDIIEMEAVVNANKDTKESFSTLFDLDYSYTYIRSKASFTTNEFIPISDGGNLRSTERILYRGY